MLTRLTAAEIAGRLRDRSVSAMEVTESFLAEIEKGDGRIGAFLHVDPEGALAAARDAQARIDAGDAGALTGVPLAVKDNLSTRGMATTCGSRILEGYVPPFDATVVELCRAAGMPILGKTNLDEFAMGTSTETSAFHPTRNPWDLDRTPGGSSGGSAAAVAAGLAPLALGSDTGGSIRQPAALCGAVGFKPTYGRVSRYGLVAFASSLDQIGPIATTVEDAALLASAISGHDGRDATSFEDARIGEAERVELKGLRFAFPRELIGGGVQPGVRRLVLDGADRLTREGAEIEEVSAPSVRYGVTAYYIIAPAEASSNLARFDGVRYGVRESGDGHVGVVEQTRGRGFGREVKTRIMIGTYALSAGYYDAYYLRAQQLRARMVRELDDLLSRYDAILSPTCPSTAFRLGEMEGDPLALKLLDACTIPANLCGLPAISLNCGFDEGLPVGLQIMGARMADERLLGMAMGVERILSAAERPILP